MAVTRMRFFLALLFIGCGFICKAHAFETKAVNGSRIDAATVATLNKMHSAAKIDSPAPVNAKAGTIAFWVKPAVDKPPSRTLFSARWPGGGRTPGYMVISDGWWESSTTPGFYFVIDNLQQVFCFVDDLFLPKNQWSQITLTWGGDGKGAFCRIYLNGKVRVDRAVAPIVAKTPQAASFFSDANSDDPKGRTFQGTTSGWVFFNQPLAHAEVTALFEQTSAAHNPVASNKFESYITSTRSAGGRESRVLFDEDIYWALSRRNTDAVIATLRQGGFNVYVPCVWHGAGTYYPSPLGFIPAQLRARINGSKEDPLAYLLEQAHKHGIAVYPWFTVTKNETTSLNKFATAKLEGAFDVHNPEFRKFIVELVVDVARRYPVDGVNLDYIRSMGICTTDSCQSDFNSRYRANLLLDAAAARVQKLVTGNVRDSAVARWNAGAVTAIVRDVATSVRNINPDIKISVDSHPLHPDFILQGHDSTTWLNQGIIDLIFAMDYRFDVDVEGLDKAKAVVKNPERIIPLYSVYDLVGGQVVPRPAAVVGGYVKLTRAKWPNSGVAFYHRKQLTGEQLLYLNDLLSLPSPPGDVQSQ